MARKLLVSVLALAACPGDYNDLVTQALNESVSEPTGSSSAPTTSLPTTTAPDEPASTGVAELTGGDTTWTSTADSSESGMSSTTEVEDLWVRIVPPADVEEIGPAVIEYDASPNAAYAELVVDDVVVDHEPVDGTLIFPVTSDKYNPGRDLTVRVYKDEDKNKDESAEDTKWQACSVKAPGSNVWTAAAPHSGMATAAALRDGQAIAAGFEVLDTGQFVGLVRGYDDTGVASLPNGWEMKHSTWTDLPDVPDGDLSTYGVDVDAEGAVVVVGTSINNNDQHMYVARFLPDGMLHWDVQGEPGSAAKGVGVKADGTIYVAGSQQTSVNPSHFDMRTWVYSADGTAHGYEPYKDPEDFPNVHDEFGRAVAVLSDELVVVAGWGQVLDDQAQTVHRGVAMLFKGKGVHVGTWVSPGDKLKHDAIFAAVTTTEGFASCGYAAATDPTDPTKRQILVRWHGMDLQETQPPRLEYMPGGGACNALGFNREGATLVGATINESAQGEGDNSWIFAVKDANSSRKDYMVRSGPNGGQDRLWGLRCDYFCAWSGAEGEANGPMKWIVGMIRG